MTAVLVVEQGAIDNERLEETMQPVQDGDSVELRGRTFSCKDVLVRKAG